MGPVEEMSIRTVLGKLSFKIKGSVTEQDRLRVYINDTDFAVVKVKRSVTFWSMAKRIWSIQLFFYHNHRYQYEVNIRSFDPAIVIEKAVEVFNKK